MIDFHGADKDSAKVAERDLLDFFKSSCDKNIYRIKYKPGKCSSAEVTLGRAYKALGCSGYHIMDNNCETFAYKVKTGKNLGSKQAAENLIKALPRLEDAVKLASASSAASIKYAAGSFSE